MRRWITPKSLLLLVVAGLISLAAVSACGGDDKSANGNATPTVTVESATPPDGSPGPTSAGPSGSETQQPSSNSTTEPEDAQDIAAATREAAAGATEDAQDAADNATEEAEQREAD